MARKPKQRKKRKKQSGSRRQAVPTIVKKVRLSQQHVLQIRQFAIAGDVDGATRTLQIFQPGLNAQELDEVIQRITDPGKLGGIETGSDPALGEYADFAITR